MTTQIDGCVHSNTSLNQIVAAGCAITGVCLAFGVAVLGALPSGLKISCMGALSIVGASHVHVDSDMSSILTLLYFTISYFNASQLHVSTMMQIIVILVVGLAELNIVVHHSRKHNWS